jgi:PhzF family phenazine biosynthesis protein
LKTIQTIVFQAAPGGGNLCPVTIDADTLSAEDMLSLTKEFGTEAAFVCQPKQSDCDFKVKYFAPLHEMGMCMHGTIGATAALAAEGLIRYSPVYYETQMGRVKIEWGKKNGDIYAAVEQFLPQKQDHVPDTEDVCRAFNIDKSELAPYPFLSIATSRFKLMIPLSRQETLDSLQPDYDLLWALCDKYGDSGWYPFFIKDEKRDPPLLYARQFPNKAGYPEDPATGVAASALGAYLVMENALPVREGWNTIEVRQGFAMGKPSVIFADTFITNGKIAKTRVRGSAKIIL